MADGTVRALRMRGDEFFNWTEDDRGYAVARGADGRWQYARRARGRWEPAGMTPQQRGREGRASDPASSPLLAATADGTSTSAAAPSPGTAAGTLAAPPSPAPLLVILVSFADKAISTTASAWADKFFGASGKTVNTYYLQASKNRFLFNPATESEGTANDGVISVTLAINHPNTANTDDTVRSAVKTALQAADPYINYAGFDSNNNNSLSTPELHLVLVFAGYEAAYSSAYTPLLWAHHWSLFSPVTAPLLDGVYVAGSSYGGGYAAVGEFHSTHAATIGVICHELGHNLTLPDLYDTDGTSDGVGAHCLMGAGNWGLAPGDSYQGQTPVLPSAYCRQAIGFSDVRVVTGEAVTNTLLQVSDSTNLTDMVRINTPNSQQFFLIENRQLSGFDAGLYIYFNYTPSGGGLAVWHVDTSVTVNSDDTWRLVDLEEAANPVLDVYGLPQGRLENYYYANNVTRFDETTSPNNVLNGGAVSLARIYNVSGAGAAMTFTSDEGASLISLSGALDVSAAQALTTGTPAWLWQSATSHDGSDAAQSGSVSKFSRTSYMSTVVTGPLQVAFWWMNAGSGTETLRFLVDGVLQASLSNTGSWTQQGQMIGSGSHTLRWEYYTSRSNGSSSAGFVDQLTLMPPSAASA